MKDYFLLIAIIILKSLQLLWDRGIIRLVLTGGFYVIVYSNTLSQFSCDVDNGVIASLVKQELEKRNIINNNESEFRAWDQSLMYMKNVLYTPEINQDVCA